MNLSWVHGVIPGRPANDSPDPPTGPDPYHGAAACESVKIQENSAHKRTIARNSIMHWMKLIRRRLHRHARSLGVMMALLLAVASVQTAWGCTGPRAVKMADCCIGTSCPQHHTTSCVQARDTAIPSMIAAGQDLHPLWVALPATPGDRFAIPASAFESQAAHESCAVASGPPIQLRFCTFLK